MAEKILVELNGVTKRFPVGNGEFTALNDIDLAIAEGEFCGFIGPSGSGKTTLLNLIGTLDKPTLGTVRLNGMPVHTLNNSQSALLRKQSLGFVFQSYQLMPYYTVYENIEFPLLLLKIPRIKRRHQVESALAWLGLSDKTRSRPAQLSGGECQRVAIARAMVKNPSLVLADEPTANLDAENSHHILQTMLQLNRDLKTTFVFATHDEKVIGYLRRCIQLRDGRISETTLQNPEGRL